MLIINVIEIRDPKILLLNVVLNIDNFHICG
jgi:hypothetical protein